jgi:hypothetical protein
VHVNLLYLLRYIIKHHVLFDVLTTVSLKKQVS